MSTGIDRKKLVKRNNVQLDHVDANSPLSVGNGEFVFTADITGLQSLYGEYEKSFPLCTMGNFGWHTSYGYGGGYTLKNLPMTTYRCENRTFFYPVKKTEENALVYDWLRKNPHKVNLYRLGFQFNGHEIHPMQLTQIRQELDVYEGVLKSSFCIQGEKVYTETICGEEGNCLGVKVRAKDGSPDKLTILLAFPYGSPEISGSDWDQEKRHGSHILMTGENQYRINRTMDDLVYQVEVNLKGARLVQTSEHCFSIELETSESGERESEILIRTDQRVERSVGDCFDDRKKRVRQFWADYWSQVGLIDLGEVSDCRGRELERREILSLYLLRLQCAGSLPPAETGLSCNSWYGKFHLEMHVWHSAFLPVFSQGRLLEKSLVWYRDHLKQAQENAARNHFKGARWPKMTSPGGEDSPSPIAPLLIWQQPHCIFMLELLYRSEPRRELLESYWEVVKESADFMADFAKWNEAKSVYELCPPLIPVQETHDPMKTRNPVFELEYWRTGLEIAADWARRLDCPIPEHWIEVGEHMAVPAQKDGVYLAHDLAEDTYTAHAMDHPSMLMAYGLLRGERIQPEVMDRTLKKVLETWSFDTAWGWDFAVMAMTAAKLGKIELAIDLLLKDTQKNEYVANGHNRQGYRKDLPLYLPGNGSFLYAFGTIAAERKGKLMPDWNVRTEGIKELY